jgi:hypothetical protein
MNRGDRREVFFVDDSDPTHSLSGLDGSELPFDRRLGSCKPSRKGTGSDHSPTNLPRLVWRVGGCIP